MPVEHVTRGLSFDNLFVEVSVDRWICDGCGTRQAFHDVPGPPYGDPVPTPEKLGWHLCYPMDDGSEQSCTCPKCYAAKEAKFRAAPHPQGKATP
jgi:hypothetical protein